MSGPPRRLACRLVVLDPAGRVLLLGCTDPGNRATAWWELPGGGVEPEEHPAAAGVREVREETGVTVPPGTVGPLQWTQDVDYSWLARRHRSRQQVRLARLVGPPALGEHAREPAEADTVQTVRWWSVDELVQSRERFFPRHLPAVLPRLLAGERVDEPYDDWDLP